VCVYVCEGERNERERERMNERDKEKDGKERGEGTQKHIETE